MHDENEVGIKENLNKASDSIGEAFDVATYLVELWESPTDAAAAYPGLAEAIDRLKVLQQEFEERKKWALEPIAKLIEKAEKWERRQADLYDSEW
jgi:hypothetical protein